MKKRSGGGFRRRDSSAPSPFTPEELQRGVLGKYYVGRKRATAGSRTVTLASDVAKLFRNDAEVNEALRLVNKMRKIGNSAGPRKSA